MNSRSIAAIAIICCLLASVPVQADKAGIVPGDTFSYSYEILTTYATPNGPNQTSITTAVLQISVHSVNTTGDVGEFGYTESVPVFNGTTGTDVNTSALNFTTIFNPYNNESYTGNIGFWPVINTDVEPGNRTNLVLHTTYTFSNDTGDYNYTGDVFFNLTVSRPAGLIDVNMSERAYPINDSVPAVDFDMKYNAMSGVMESYAEYANIYSIVEKIFYYNLVSFSPPSRANYSWAFYVVAAVIVVRAAVEVARRKSAPEKKKAKMREKFASK